MPRPLVPIPRPASTLVVVATMVALCSLVASCARELPLAPGTIEGSRGWHTTRYSHDDVANQVVITVPVGTDLDQLAQDYSAALLVSEDWGCAVLRPPAGMSPDTLSARLASDPRILTSERNTLFENVEARQQSFGFDDGFGSAEAAATQRAISVIDLGAAHQVSQGAGVTIAILDTGVDPTHPLFRGRLVGGYDLVDGDYSPTDVGNGLDDDGDGQVDEAYGHGTHVAGIAAMTAPQSKLMIVRVLDADGFGDMWAVASGIHWAVAHGAKVINLSLGSLNKSDAVSTALDYARVNRVLVFAAAGNRGTDNPTEFPAHDSHTFAIAADDSHGTAALFTSYGSFVDITAPGVDVRSAYPGGRWYLWSGTSMSTPFVAGTAALLLAVHPMWTENDVATRLAASARPVAPATPQMVGKLGAGALDVGAALAPDMPPSGDTGEGLSRPVH